MFKYLIAEIAGKQFMVFPGQEVRVPFLGEVSELECDKILLISEADKLQIGDPYLKDKQVFEVLKSVRGPKIRVATYKAKANYRRVVGSKAKMSLIKLKEATVKKA